MDPALITFIVICVVLAISCVTCLCHSFFRRPREYLLD